MPRKSKVSNAITGNIFLSTVIQGNNVTIQLPPRIMPALSALPRAKRVFAGRDKDLDSLRISRRTFRIRAAFTLQYSQHMPMKAVVTPDAAIALLDGALRIAHPEDARIAEHPEDARKIVQLCGGLPLALHLVAAHLADDLQRSLADMEADLRSESTRLEEMRYENFQVRAPFDLTLRRLAIHHIRMFRLFSVNPGPDISTRSAAALADWTQVAARRSLQALARAHLVDHGGSYGRWRMHDLVRLFSREIGIISALDDGRDAALERLLNYYLDTARAADAHLGPYIPDAAKLGFAARSQALDWLDAEYANLVASTSAAAEGQDNLTAARDIPHAIRDFLLWRRHFNDWISMAEIARDAARRLGDKAGEAVALNTRGIALDQARRPREAISAHEGAADIFRSIGDSQGAGMTVNNLGIALQDVGEFERASFAHREAANILRAAGNRQGEARALNNLGNSLRELGRFDDSTQAHQEAVQIYRDLQDSLGEARALGNLANALREWGQLEQAIKADRNAIEIYREAGDWYSEGRTFGNLGIALGRIGRMTEALAAHERELEVCLRAEDKHGEGIARKNIGIALAQMDRAEEAAADLQSALSIFRELGDEREESSTLEALRRSAR